MPVPFHPALVQTWFHKLLRGIAFRLSMGAIVNATFASVSVLGTGYLTIIRLPDEHKLSGWILLIVLIFLIILKGLLSWRSSRRDHYLQRRAIFAWMRFIHEELLNNSTDFRLTFFVRDPVAMVRDSESREWCRILVPFIRRESGQPEYERPTSRTYFALNSNAAAARSWRESTAADRDLAEGRFDAFVTRLGEFQNKEEMIKFTTEEYGLEHDVANRLSRYMTEVVEILTFPMVDGDGAPMGVLSIDCRGKFILGDSVSGDPAQRVSQEQLQLVLRGMRSSLSQIGVPGVKATQD